LELKNDPHLIEESEFWHKEANRQPEFPQGIREAGILDFDINTLENRFFYDCKTLPNFDGDTSFTALSILNILAEWRRFIVKFQLANPGAASSEKRNFNKAKIYS